MGKETLLLFVFPGLTRVIADWIAAIGAQGILACCVGGNLVLVTAMRANAAVFPLFFWWDIAFASHDNNSLLRENVCRQCSLTADG
jgi:hypothetical protein